MKTVLAVIAVGCMITGCGVRDTPELPAGTPDVQALELTEAKVIEIARKAVQVNDTWADRAEFEATKNADDTWSVTVWRIERYDEDGKPQFVPGGHRLVIVDRQGKVTDYMRGK